MKFFEKNNLKLKKFKRISLLLKIHHFPSIFKPTISHVYEVLQHVCHEESRSKQIDTYYNKIGSVVSKLRYFNNPQFCNRSSVKIYQNFKP